ncbi:hypothetical protein [Pseudoalteromonas virus vB_PspP-H6/1]|nr:hypothetical protein [Pseudoalteromonas virus vB_PspP-H6/1]
MSKIIIHNESKIDDRSAIECVAEVVKMGFISGQNQYCWVSQFAHPPEIKVLASKTRGKTHTFKVMNNA